MSKFDKKDDSREKKSSGYFNSGDSYYKSRYSSGGYSSSYYSSSDDDDEDDKSYIDRYYQSRRKEYRSTWYDEGRYSSWRSGGSTTSSTTRTTTTTTWGGGYSYYTPPRETMSSLIGSFGRSYYSGSVSSDKREQINKILDSSIKLTKEFIAILDLPFKINISFDTSDLVRPSSENNIRNIYIPTKIFDYIEKLSLTDDQVINTTVGLGIHEAAHLLYSSALLYNSVLINETTYRKFLFDLIEDERVEDCLLRERPGYSDFIKFAREYKVNDAEKGLDFLKSNASSDFDMNGDFYKVFINVIYTLRYPSLIDKEVIKDNMDFFNEINKKIDETKLNCSKDSLSLAESLVKILEKHYSSKLYNKTVNDSLLDRDFQLYYGSPLMYGNDGDLTFKYPGIGNIIEKLSSSLVKDGEIKLSTKVSLGICELGDNKTVFYKDCTESKEEYLKIARAVSKHVPCIKKKILDVDKNTTVNIYGCRQGLLDTTKIAEAIQGVPQVYYRTCEVKTSKVAVGVLIDESGSMSGDRIDRAREAAILLNEALGSINGIEFFVYGHSADQFKTGNTEITVYREPGFEKKYALSKVTDKYENRDGVAILEVAKRIRKFTQTPTLLFVLSDGEPSANNYRGDDAIEDTAKKVKQVESTMGMSVVQITISDFYRSSYLRYSHINSMFSKSIHLERDLDNLAIELGKVLRNEVIENKTTTMSF